MRSWIAVVGGVLLATSPLSAAEFAGHYSVAGKSPNGGSYSGTVDITRTADKVYNVVWMIGSEKSVGTGIGSGSGSGSEMAVGYKNSDSFGICFLVLEGETQAKAVWTYAGSKKLGYENWTRD